MQALFVLLDSQVLQHLDHYFILYHEEHRNYSEALRFCNVDDNQFRKTGLLFYVRQGLHLRNGIYQWLKRYGRLKINILLGIQVCK